MSNSPNPQSDHAVETHRHSDQPVIYQIRVEGHLDGQWAKWLDGMIITLEENGETLLTTPVVDQAALFGLLRKVRDVGAPLVSVVRLDATDADVSEDIDQ